MADQDDDEKNFSEIIGDSQQTSGLKIAKVHPKSKIPDKAGKPSTTETDQKIVVTVVHKMQVEPKAQPEPESKPASKPEPKQEPKPIQPKEIKKTTTTTTTYIQEEQKPDPEEKKPEKKNSEERKPEKKNSEEQKPEPAGPEIQLIKMIRTDASDPYECPNCKVVCLEDKVPCCVKACIIIASIFLFPFGLCFLIGLKCKRKECTRCRYKEKKAFTAFYVCFILFFLVPYILGTIVGIGVGIYILMEIL